MAVDAVMSMMGTGLGDAVVEVVYRVVLAHAGHIGADWHVVCARRLQWHPTCC